MESILNRRYRVDKQKVIFEDFEDETVLINLDTGAYYSFTGSGAFIWEMLSAGQTGEEIVARLATRFPANADIIQPSVNAYVRTLLDENLLLENGSADILSTTVEMKSMPQFETPNVQKYSDMQDLLLMDPIHEVDETGWPHNPAQPKQTG